MNTNYLTRFILRYIIDVAVISFLLNAINIWGNSLYAVSFSFLYFTLRIVFLRMQLLRIRTSIENATDLTTFDTFSEIQLNDKYDKLFSDSNTIYVKKRSLFTALIDLNLTEDFTILISNVENTCTVATVSKNVI